MRPVVIVPVRNRLDLTQPLVEELLRHGDCKVILHDNGSTDGTRDWARHQRGLIYADSAALALHEMWNDGLELAQRRHSPAIFLNNDLRLDGKPEWVSRLCGPFDYGWAALCPNYDGRIGHAAVEPVRGVAAGRMDGTGGLAGFAFAVAPAVAEWYRFPTEAKWWYGDTDLARTLDDRDLACGMVLGVGVTHLGGGSQTARDYDLEEQIRADREWFERKWGPLA